MYANVVVGINGLRGDRDAIALAKALSAENPELALVHVRVAQMLPTKGSNGEFEVAERALSDDVLQRQRRAYAADAEIVSVSAMSVGAGLHQVAAERGADLLVVGGCHHGAVGRVFTGDDARSALHHAPCAVALAPAGFSDRSGRFETIAVAFDGSEESSVALAHGGLLALNCGANLIARDVVPWRIYGAGSWALSAALMEEPRELVASERARLGAIPGARVDVVVGQAREELGALSGEVDLLVCGSRQLDATKRVLLGSTSDYLARHSRCPLLVTPATDDEHLSAWRELRDRAAV